MKKTNFKRILSLILVCIALVGAAVGISVSAEETSGTTSDPEKIVAKNIWQGEAFKMMYAVPQSVVDNANEVDVTIYVDGEKFSDTTREALGENEKPKGYTCYAFVANTGLPAQDINVNLSAVLTIDGEVKDTVDYSILEYYYERLLVSSGATEDQRAMYKAILAYARTAEKVLYAEGSDAAANRKSNPVEGYSYVRVSENGTIDGTKQAGIYKNGTVLTDITTSLVSGDGEEIQWSAVTYNDDGTTASQIYTTEELANNGFTVESNVILTPIKVTGGVLVGELSFADTANRVSQDTASQVWKQNGITFTNAKESSSTNVADYYNPVRCYKGSSIKIEYTDLVKIEVICNSASYATALENSTFSNATVSTNDSTVTFILTETADAFTISSLSDQVRIDSINVYAVSVVTDSEAGGDAECSHVWNDGVITTQPTCSEAGVKTFTCTVDGCGETKTEGVDATAEHTDNGTGVCGTCGTTISGSETPEQGGTTTEITYTATAQYTDTTTTNMTGGDDASEIGLDDNIFSAVAAKCGNSTYIGLNKAGEIRLYASKNDGNGSELTISIAEGYTIESIKITFGTNYNNCAVIVDGSTIATSSDQTLETDINANSFVLKNVTTGSNTQVYIKSIEIVYTTA